jgi:predicted O-methyltransferase YrrM
MFSWWKRRSLLVGYAYYCLHAVNQQSLKTPFVYKFYDEVIRGIDNHPDFQAIECYRQTLLTSQQAVTITELGAGSSVRNGRVRSVDSIARHSLSPPKFGRFLFRLVQFLKPATIIEFGTSLGATTLYLSLADDYSKVYTLEGCPETAQIAQQGFQQFKQSNIEVKLGNIDDTLPALLQEVPAVDLAYVDANHRQGTTLSYFEQLLTKISESSVLVFDDIYWSFEMMEAWRIIKNHPRVTLSLDLFDAGLVFFRPHQTKQHYTLKF